MNGERSNAESAIRSREWREKNRDRSRAYHKEWYANNKDKCKESSRRWQANNPNVDINKHYRRKYGITIEDYIRILSEQGGVCAICHGPQSRRGRFCVDHLHGTRVVRGLLCHQCNAVIGMVKESTRTLSSMVEYLGADL